MYVACTKQFQIVAALYFTKQIFKTFQDPRQLREPGTPLKDTAALIGHVVNQLPESHADYNMAISLVELVQSLM